MYLWCIACVTIWVDWVVFCANTVCHTDVDYQLNIVAQAVSYECAGIGLATIVVLLEPAVLRYDCCNCTKMRPW